MITSSIVSAIERFTSSRLAGSRGSPGSQGSLGSRGSQGSLGSRVRWFAVLRANPEYPQNLENFENPPNLENSANHANLANPGLVLKLDAQRVLQLSAEVRVRLTEHLTEVRGADGSRRVRPVHAVQQVVRFDPQVQLHVRGQRHALG